MFEGFQPRRGGGAVATLSAVEADLLRSLAAQMIELLRSEEAVQPTDVDPLENLLDFDGPTTAPEDPVLARLFPTARTRYSHVFSRPRTATTKSRPRTSDGSPRRSYGTGRRPGRSGSSRPWKRQGCRRSSRTSSW